MKDGGPAFPGTRVDHCAGLRTETPVSGMTLRDWFAGQALVGFMHWLGNESQDDRHACTINTMPDYCYAVADMMLKAREQSNG